jgi:glycogen debranching enzyme
MRIPGERINVRDIICLALRHQDLATGLVPNRLPDFSQCGVLYNSTDATLLCVIAANVYIQTTKDMRFIGEVLPRIANVISSFLHSPHGDAEAPPVGAHPRVDPKTGLLLSIPHHSWIDTRNQCVEYAGWNMEHLPNRVSAAFVKDLYDEIGNKTMVEGVLSSPCLFLPEVNAQWIVLLRGALETIELFCKQAPDQAAMIHDIGSLRDTVYDILSRAEQHFKVTFWNAGTGFLFNVVHEKGSIKDEIECEAAVTAAAMLGRTIFSSKELHAMWNRVRQRLLVFRKPVRYGATKLPFGIITKNDDQRIYYGDSEYHADTIWLRSTPYLIKLLQHLGEQETIEQLLINTLDHQITEGAIFYNHELLSRPCGNNAHTCEQTHRNPVPVKNPIQFWSQWCDAFVGFFSESE